MSDEAAQHFGLVIDRLTGQLRRIFNPDYEWEFAHHHVDHDVEYMRMEHKEDWGVPLTPNGMTFMMAWEIARTINNGRNYRPGDE